MKRVIYYHKGCPDGFASAWAAWKKFGYDAEYIPIRHNYNFPRHEGCQIYFLDICPSKKDLILLESKNRVVVLDHHKSAKEVIESCKEYVFDLNRSGAGISWDYFFGFGKRSKLIDIIEDRDLWRFSIDGSREVLLVLDSLEKKFEVWDDFNDEISHENSLSNPNLGYEKMRGIGENILRYQNLIISKICSNYSVLKILNKKVAVVNSPVFQSEIGNYLVSDLKFELAAVYYEKKGLYIFSLRSKKEGVDCSEIASEFGGGGHHSAAGFVSKTLDEVFGDV